MHSSTYAFEFESFETGWTEITSNGVIFDPSGTYLNIGASSTEGSNEGTYSKNFVGDHGVVAKFNISTANSSTNTGGKIGIKKILGSNMSGQVIQAQLYLEYWDGLHTIKYQVLKLDAENHSQSVPVSGGVLGEMQSWPLGEDIMLAFAFKNNIIYFYCTHAPDHFTQVDLFDINCELDNETEIFAHVSGNSAMNCTVSNLRFYREATYIPHITSNPEWTDYLLIDNNSAFDASYTLTLYTSSGIETYNAVHDISANSEAVLQPKTLAPTASNGIILSTNKDLFFRYFYESNNGGVAEFKLNKEGNVYTQAGFYFNSTAGLVEWKGLAITNFSNTATYITLYAYGNGGLLGTVSDGIPGNGKLVGVHTRWFPSVDIDDLKRIIVVASNNLLSLGGIVICGNSDNSSLLFTNASNASGFVPPPQ